MSIARSASRLWLCGALLGATPAFPAQAGSAQLTGLVRDQARAAVPGVVMTLTRLATGEARIFVTNSAGLFAAAGLPPGEYQVRARLAGFRPLVHNGIRLVAGETARLDLELAVSRFS